mgnify:CR=1 FL=1
MCSSYNAGLLESGCTDFLRVGPLRRINRQLLRQSLHCRSVQSSNFYVLSLFP